ncbi:GIY-YIG nuclease family protein (plasmid) [Streptomyces sp. GDS52]|uniref:GIY-YIG nuclease family protein n=1 Tax=Streptomyces sp. GDS52 TaxID=3406419 RepID=UPI003FD020C3
MSAFIACASTECSTPAALFIADIPVCEEHRKALHGYFTQRTKPGPRIDMAEIFRLQKAQQASRVCISSREALTPAQSAVAPDAAEEMGCVYYITWRRDDRFVKIGTTRTASRRFKDLNGPTGDRIRLLVAEPGSYAQEALRHEQFANLRKPRTELFDYTQEIVDHIAKLRQRFPHYRDFTDVGMSYD